MNQHRRNVRHPYLSAGIDDHIERLYDMPVWAFHGRLDTVVPFDETERIIRRIEGRNGGLRFSAEPHAGHALHGQVYPGREIYDRLLRLERGSRERPGIEAEGEHAPSTNR